MFGFTIHTGNRLENLADALAQSLRVPLAEPFARELIVVQSGGMARWVTQEIARRTGLAMNLECPFPGAFALQVLRTFFPDLPQKDEFAADVLAWRIHRLLPSLMQENAFAEVRRYLAAGDGMMRFQLSEKIAQAFDQYLVHRPEMLMEWECGAGGGDWQAMLWRALAENRTHLATIHERLGRRISASEPRPAGLPERVSIFGISSLPPFYLRVFFELSRQCDVRLFSLQPAREYFGHDLPPKQRAKLLARLAQKGATISDDTLPEGNPLLASMGRLHRDFIELRIGIDEEFDHLAQEAPEQFLEPGENDLLHLVQSDILHARSRGHDDVPKKVIAPEDRSIEVHACHSPMREVEVLYDQLLALFDADPSLRPRDVLVLTPDIEKYAPFVQAVFDCPETESRRIPFSVADRHPRTASATAATFLALLELAESRCTASEVFALLESSSIRRRFAFADDDLETIRRWMGESGIRWGIDGMHRAGLDLPAQHANSWRAGLDRLLLGYAMAGENRRMFEGIMPCDGVEGTGAELLGRFISAVEAMFRLVASLPAPRPLAAWPEALREIVDDFFAGDEAEEASELRAIRAAIERLRSVASIVGDSTPVEFCVVRHHLESLLDAGAQRGGFLTGRVTFAALKPNRSIPSRVLCLLGLDDLSFPRQVRPPAFDQIASDPRCGDHSLRDEDRGIFLEALLSTRERLHISFVGRSARDNEALPPSILVSELLDYLDRACTFPEKQNARSFVVTGHRLHAFSPVYFSGKDARRFSYSEANAAASRALLRPVEDGPHFLAKPLPEPDAGARLVDLRSLAEFFVNPAKHFLRRRLGLTLDETDDALDDVEPFVIGALDAYPIKQELLEQALAHDASCDDGWRARGLLPHGTLGAARFLGLRAEAADFAKTIAPEMAGAQRDEPLLVKLQIGAFSLAGKIEPLYGGRLVLFRCATLKPKDRIRAWILHLALCAAGEGKIPPSLLLGTGKDHRVNFPPVENAGALLASLLDLYWRGLSRPLPFFPASGFAFANAKAGDDSKRLRAASVEWNGRPGAGGEKADQWFALCFGEGDPLDEEFAQISRTVFFPMLETEADA